MSYCEGRMCKETQSGPGRKDRRSGHPFLPTLSPHSVPRAWHSQQVSTPLLIGHAATLETPPHPPPTHTPQQSALALWGRCLTEGQGQSLTLVPTALLVEAYVSSSVIASPSFYSHLSLQAEGRLAPGHVGRGNVSKPQQAFAISGEPSLQPPPPRGGPWTR